MDLKRYLVLGAFVALLGVLIFSGGDDTTKAKQTAQNSVETKNNLQSEEKSASVVKYEQTTNNFQSIIKKDEQTGFIRVSNQKNNVQNPTNYQQNIPNHIYRQQIAKQRYEREQIQRAQIQKAQKSRSNYYEMQRVMSNRTPIMVKSNEEYIQNRYVRAQVARNEYMQQQQKMQQQMKMRSKIERVNR